ncbi:MAG: hypothetical protein QM820_47390 [Minicystis sp.]
MYRLFSLSLLALAACTTVTIAEPPIEKITPRGSLSDEGEGGTGGAPSAPTCAPDSAYLAAPEGTPACGGDVVCDADADCAIYPGNYCQQQSCADDGCLRGSCALTKVQGQLCARDGECVSNHCVCTVADPLAPCICAPEDGLGSPGFP